MFLEVASIYLSDPGLEVLFLFFACFLCEMAFVCYLFKFLFRKRGYGNVKGMFHVKHWVCLERDFLFWV